MADLHANFAYSTVLTAPSPAASGTSLVVQSGDGAKFPSVSFNATVWPVGVNPTTTNAEIVRVTAISTDTFTITRTQESTSARTIVVGDQIAATITKKTLTDAETPDSDVTLTTTDVTNNNVTSTKHGFAPKSPADGTLFLNGLATPTYTSPRIQNVVSKTTTYTATTADDVILHTAAAAWTLTLYTAVGNTGKILYIKRTDASNTTNFCTVDANASETIDGNLTYKMLTQYETLKIVSDGSNWLII